GGTWAGARGLSEPLSEDHRSTEQRSRQQGETMRRWGPAAPGSLSRKTPRTCSHSTKRPSRPDPRGPRGPARSASEHVPRPYASPGMIAPKARSVVPALMVGRHAHDPSWLE